MRIKAVEIENFRLLRDVAVGLEERTTLIIGRNNSGKTSIAELFRRLLSDKSLSFRIEDFSLGCHERFWTAFRAFQAGQSAPTIIEMLPSIKVAIEIAYDVDSADLGPLGDCIVDLDPACTEGQRRCNGQPAQPVSRIGYPFSRRVHGVFGCGRSQ
jgi:putative ATP-dependent endonuclease of the OLD family